MTQHNFNHEIHCATESHRRGNKPACRHHLLQAIESLDAPQPRHIRDLPLGTKVQNTDAQIWRVIKHETEVQRVKLRLVTSENHQEWDAPEDIRVEWRVTGCCEIWTIVDGCGELSLSCARTDHAACGECETDTECDCRCHTLPFTWQDAERIMLAGGECESTHPEIPCSYARCRIVGGRRAALLDGLWMLDPNEHVWEHLYWRPYNPEAQR